ncbi:nucleotidyl transferase AbiEii/AbiGii toxin family protein [Legionella sp. CNM-1927-20]|uniref:nucleotidyl transferase AbiEii/AbiGii toxin family protein n=1 Tax=Legionella sp. CNM-1927-20 TaxID=3422221 RepID=UPI00403B0F4F
MKISKEKLQQEAAITGFKMEHLEKVHMLMDLLADFASFPQLKDKIVLKGGTALNLFFFNLPRLSVDIDLNYIGSIDRETMLTERPILQKTISAICERHSLILDRNPNRHAGGKMVWRYPSALGQMGNLEIDLNFMYRIPLWPIELKSSCAVGSKQIHNIPILDPHELSAGKLVALIDRKTGRDLFDAYHLLTETTLNISKLRLALIVYSAINRKVDLRQLIPQVISVDLNDLKNRLLPLLRKSELASMNSTPSWAKQLVQECQEAFKYFLPLKDNEQAFLNELLDNGNIKPELICDDFLLIDNIKSHPAVRWSAHLSKKI